MAAGSDYQGRTQKGSLGIQGYNKEGQSSTGVESGNVQKGKLSREAFSKRETKGSASPLYSRYLVTNDRLRQVPNTFLLWSSRRSAPWIPSSLYLVAWFGKKRNYPQIQENQLRID